MEQAKWLPVIVDALRWIKDAKQFEKNIGKIAQIIMVQWNLIQTLF